MKETSLAIQVKEFRANIQEKKTTPMFIKSIVGEYSLDSQGNSSLKIKPSFQRLYKWEKERKMKFVESMFLNIPIPPIFLFEDTLNYSSFELVDGLQRVSTILEFIGVLRSENIPWSLVTLKEWLDTYTQTEIELVNKIIPLEIEKDRLRNEKTSYLLSNKYEESKKISSHISKINQDIIELLNEIKKIKKSKLYSKIEQLGVIEFERSIEELYISKVTIPNIQEKECSIKLNFLSGLNNKHFDSLDEDGLRRTFLNFEIIVNSLSTNDVKLKYEVFNRLNTGGVNLTNQEVRNSTILNYNENLFKTLMQLRENSDFDEIMQLSDELKQEEKDTEFILRFFALGNLTEKLEKEVFKVTSIKDLLDNEMWSLIKQKKFDSHKESFNNIFSILKIINVNILKKEGKGRVLIPAFDTIIAGLLYNYKKDTLLGNNEIKLRISKLFESNTFLYHIGPPWFVEHKLEYGARIGMRWFDSNHEIDKIMKSIDNEFGKSLKGSTHSL